jgi:integrase
VAAEPSGLRCCGTPLSAACNLALKERKEGDPLKLNFNPFSGIVRKPKPNEAGASERRAPLSDADVKACKRKLGTLSELDHLLFCLLAASGMRLGEAFQINGEEANKGGPRYCIIGTKSEGSGRRVPFPAAVLAHLPKNISGQLFPLLPPSGRQTAIQRTAAAASKRLNKFIRRCGITDPNKVVHSLRHRAEDQLREADCPEKISNVLLGHGGETTVADSYGKGFSTKKLKMWIDRIGF